MDLKIEKKICHDGSEGFECNFEIGKKKFFASLCMVPDGFTNSAEPPLLSDMGINRRSQARRFGKTFL